MGRPYLFCVIKDNVVIRLINIGYMGAVAVDSSREKVVSCPVMEVLYTQLPVRMDGF